MMEKIVLLQLSMCALPFWRMSFWVYVCISVVYDIWSVLVAESPGVVYI